MILMYILMLHSLGAGPGHFELIDEFYSIFFVAPNIPYKYHTYILCRLFGFRFAN